MMSDGSINDQISWNSLERSNSSDSMESGLDSGSDVTVTSCSDQWAVPFTGACESGYGSLWWTEALGSYNSNLQNNYYMNSFNKADNKVQLAFQNEYFDYSNFLACDSSDDTCNKVSNWPNWYNLDCITNTDWSEELSSSMDAGSPWQIHAFPKDDGYASDCNPSPSSDGLPHPANLPSYSEHMLQQQLQQEDLPHQSGAAQELVTTQLSQHTQLNPERGERQGTETQSFECEPLSQPWTQQTRLQPVPQWDGQSVQRCAAIEADYRLSYDFQHHSLNTGSQQQFSVKLTQPTIQQQQFQLHHTKPLYRFQQNWSQKQRQLNSEDESISSNFSNINPGPYMATCASVRACSGGSITEAMPSCSELNNNGSISGNWTSSESEMQEVQEDVQSSDVKRLRLKRILDYFAQLNTGSSHVQLWQFLLELLNYPSLHFTCIRWEDKENGEFRIVDPDELALKWGRRKKRPHMTYDKMGRALRYYYEKMILTKIAGKKCTYRFNVAGLLCQGRRTLGSKISQAL